MDGKFKVWELLEDVNIYKPGETWSCERVGYYRGQPALCGDFSLDNHLGIGFGHTLTIWNFDEHRMTTAISVLPEDNPIRMLQFGTTPDEKQLVAVLSNQDLAVWNMSSQVCIWRLTTKPDVLCKHMASGLFAAFFGSKICLFQLSSPEPKEVLASNEFSHAIAAAFASDDEGDDAWKRLYFITDTQKLMRMDRDGSELACEIQAQAADCIVKRTPFAELLAASKASKQKSSVLGRYSNYETNMQLLSGAAHSLPAVASIGSRFAESCLAKKGRNEYEGEETLPDPSSEITFASLKALYSQ